MPQAIRAWAPQAKASRSSPGVRGCLKRNWPGHFARRRQSKGKRKREANETNDRGEETQGRGRASSVICPPSEFALATYWLNAERAASRACLNATQVQCTRDWDLRSVMRVSTRVGNTERLRISLRSAMLLSENATRCLQVGQQRPLVSKDVPVGPKDDRQLEPRRRQSR